MQPEIITRDRIILAGLSFFGDPFSRADAWEEDNEIGRLWNRFFSFYGEHKDQLKYIRNEKAMFEVHIENTATAARGMYEVFVGLELTKIDAFPFHGLLKILPAATYAVFTLAGNLIFTDWARDVYQEWLPAAGYKRCYTYGFNLYDERFRGMDKLDESELDVYIPVSKL